MRRLAQFCVCFLKRVQGEERLNDSCLHIENTRAVGLFACDAEGPLAQRAAE